METQTKTPKFCIPAHRPEKVARGGKNPHFSPSYYGESLRSILQQNLGVLMEIHLSAEEIKNYLARKVTRSELDRVSDHLYSCTACHRGLLAELEKRFPIVIDLDELAGLQDWHLEAEELTAFLEGRMDELDFECACLHLEEC